VSQPELSVVMACSGAGEPSEEVLAGLRRGCDGIATELIVVSAGDGGSEDVAAAHFPDVLVARRPANTLTPILWGDGCRLARGRIVAFTTNQMRVAPLWARKLLEALESGATGAAGPVGLGPGPDRATAAAYFTRFSLFAPHLWTVQARARDIPGDNAAYRREAILRHPDLVEQGFWEVEFHRRFETEGGFLLMEPAASATLIGSVPFGALLRQRYRHAREFGESRVARHGERRLKLLLLAPLVPLVLMVRVGRRVLPAGGEKRLFLGALPRLALLSMAWAAGEAIGALRSRPKATG